MISSAGQSVADPDTAAGMAYVSTLDDTCAYADGYQCVQPVVDDFMFSPDKMVPAAYLAAWPVVYADFLQQADLNAEQKKLKHYQIGFTETATDYVVIFRALLLPAVSDGKASGVLRTTLGQSMRYVVSKETLAVREMKWYR